MISLVVEWETLLAVAVLIALDLKTGFITGARWDA